MSFVNSLGRNSLLPIAVGCAAFLMRSEIASPIVKVGLVSSAALACFVRTCFSRRNSNQNLQDRAVKRHLTENQFREEVNRDFVCRRDPYGLIQESLRNGYFQFALEIMERVEGLENWVWGEFLESVSGDAPNGICMDLLDRSLAFKIARQLPSEMVLYVVYKRTALEILLAKVSKHDSIELAEMLYQKIPPNVLPKEVKEIHLAMLSQNQGLLEEKVSRLEAGFLKQYYPKLLNKLYENKMFSKNLAITILNVLDPEKVDEAFADALIKMTPDDEKLEVLQALVEKMPAQNAEKICLSLSILNRMIKGETIPPAEINNFVDSLDVDLLLDPRNEISPLGFALVVASLLKGYEQVVLEMIRKIDINSLSRPIYVGSCDLRIYDYIELLPSLDVFLEVRGKIIASNTLSAEIKDLYKQRVLEYLSAAKDRRGMFSENFWDSSFRLASPEIYREHIKVIEKLG